MSEPWRALSLIWSSFVLTFSALLPLVNPLGSALVLLGLVGPEPAPIYRSLAGRIALNTILFFIAVQLIGSAALAFFGISLPIVQVSGGIVIASMAWSLLNQKESQPSPEKMQAAAQAEATEMSGTLQSKTFYPFTFPLTAGPGCIVVMLTLSAHMPQATWGGVLLAHTGTLLAVVALSGLVYLCYANAPRLTTAISASTAHGILRVIAFILLCIGVQITWNGLQPLLSSILRSR
jgi:multiple antibiotic resistance protein